MLDQLLLMNPSLFLLVNYLGFIAGNKVLTIK